MKKFLIPVLLIISFASCNKESNNLETLKFLEVIPGGCTDEKSQSDTKMYIPENDTLTYTITGDTLEIFVGFNATCCGQYNTSWEIKSDTIFINIITTQPGICDCICYYTYTFKFSGTIKSYYYYAKIDDYLTFTGRLKL